MISHDLDVASLYMQEIRKYPLLNVDEEHFLFCQYARGDTGARERLILSNLRLVVNIAKRYNQHSGFDFMDLIQEGNVGLIKAVDRFDHTRGNRFSTYAAFWIKREIIKAFDYKARIIRLPSHIHEKIQQLKALLGETEGELTNQILSEKMQITEREVVSIKQDLLPVLSLNRLAEEDDETEYAEFIINEDISDPETVLMMDSVNLSLYEAMKCLDLREEGILRMRYGFDVEESLTLKEIGEIYGITKERVRQIENNSLKVLQRSPQLVDLQEEYFL